MIYIVCGMIGAGKTTYAQKHDCFTDIDIDKCSKQKQIEKTLLLAKSGQDVYHVTCYPTSEELERLEPHEVKYLWINTTLNQAMKNIKKRGRERDMIDMKETRQVNIKIQNRYLYSNIKFDIVNLFETNERW